MNAPAELTITRSQQIAAYVAGALTRDYPAEVLTAAKLALIDTIGCAVGAWDDECVRPVRRVVEGWRVPGKAQVFVGGSTAPAFAALANGAMAHAMDYDDAHQMGAGHISCPCATAALAVAGELGSSGKDTLAAFITAFEVMARVGGGGPQGVGRNLHRRGLHPTSVFGRIGAAVAAAVLMRLTPQQIEYAIGAATTTAGGMVGSFGTHAKPFHGGKAAMDGILAAELAKEGFQSSNKLLELEKGIYDVFIQTRDRPVDIPPMDFSYWEIKRNGFKPYAACRATHASIQSSRKLASQVAGRKINKVHIKVHPNVAIVANNPAPQTPLAHKFSVRYCVAMGLTGYRLVASDFNEKLLQDKKLKEIAAVSEVEVVADQPQYEAHLTVHVEGEKKPLHADTLLVLGHADNPMSEDEVWGKFDGLVAPVLGSDNARKLYDLLKQFEAPGNLERFTGMVARG
jgi:2-methylcitrate dehydratase PrpD